MKNHNKTGSLYSLHLAFAMEETAAVNIEKRTGLTFEQWTARLKKEGLKDEAAQRKWLMGQGLSTNYAWWVAERAAGRGSAAQYDPAAYVEEQYQGAKRALRPIYEKVLHLGLSLAEDVKACPCETMVPLYRKHVFAQLCAATQSRVDLSLVLGDAKPAGRLKKIQRRQAGDRLSHIVALTDAAQVDAEVEKWLRAAYALGDEKQSRAPAGPVKTPSDFTKALAASPKAKTTWESCTDRMRADWIALFDQAAKPETRSKRISTAFEKLAAGKKKMY